MYIGDFAASASVGFKFNTEVNGIPYTLAGSPVISVWKTGSTAPITAGVTLTADYQSVTGLNNVVIDLSASGSYAAGADYQVYLSAGSVNSVSQIGRVVGQFSIEHRSSGVLTAAAIADAVFDEPTSGHTTSGTYGDKLGAHLPAVLKVVVGVGSTTTSVVLNSSTGIDGGAPSSVNDFYTGRVLIFTSGALAGQATSISTYTGSTKTLTVVALTSGPSAAVTAVIV